jgi:F420-non-reducing hydrogenase iron-sulfur subunit
MQVVETVESEKSAVLQNFEPRIVMFLCTWCSYTGADLAGTARMKYPPNVVPIRVMCSGRIDVEFILRAFREGADGVAVCGCHIGDCHYISGNYKTMGRMPIVKKFLGQMGIEPERFRLEWISAAEGEKFQRVASDMTKDIKRLGPLNWKETMIPD